MKYRLPESAHAALRALRETLIQNVGMRLMTAKEAQEIQWEHIRKLCASAMAEDNGTAYPIQCSGCGEITIVASDVLRYKCKCSPNVERYTHQSRLIDLQIGQTPIEQLLAANRGPSLRTIH